MSELAKSNMSPVLPRIQEVCGQPEVMNGVIITYRMCGGLMRNYGCQAEQNRHISGWKMEGKRQRNRTASDQQALQQSILQKETITISEVLLLFQDTASVSPAQTSTSSRNSLLLAS